MPRCSENNELVAIVFEPAVIRATGSGYIDALRGTEDNSDEWNLLETNVEDHGNFFTHSLRTHELVVSCRQVTTGATWLFLLQTFHDYNMLVIASFSFQVKGNWLSRDKVIDCTVYRSWLIISGPISWLEEWRSHDFHILISELDRTKNENVLFKFN